MGERWSQICRPTNLYGCVSLTLSIIADSSRLICVLWAAGCRRFMGPRRMSRDDSHCNDHKTLTPRTPKAGVPQAPEKTGTRWESLENMSCPDDVSQTGDWQSGAS